jgi:hypothetical protein
MKLSPRSFDRGDFYFIISFDMLFPLSTRSITSGYAKKQPLAELRFSIFRKPLILKSIDKLKQMKNYLLIIIGAFFFGNAFSQKTSLEITWGKDEVIVNKTAINVNSTLPDIRKALGNESRSFSVDDKPSRLYIYDELGLSVVIDTVAQKLDKIDIDWSPGRSESDMSPKKLFDGDLIINGKPVLVKDRIAAIKTKTKVPFEKMGLFYWYTVDHGEFSITIAYATKAEEKIRAVYILFRNTAD